MPGGVLRRLAMAGAATALFFGLLEGVARLLPGDLAATKEVAIEGVAGTEAMVGNLDVPGWDLKVPDGVIAGFAYQANHWHMRGPEYEDPKPADAVRVILVGDSSIFGYQLPWEETMGARLGQLREARFPGRRYEVANCAVPGHSTVQSLLKLQRHCLAFQPDLVIIGNLYSDSAKGTLPDRQRFRVPKSARLTAALDRLALYRLMRNYYVFNVVYKDGPPTQEVIPQVGAPDTQTGLYPRVDPDEYADNLRQLIDLSRDAGAATLLLMLPSQADLLPIRPRADYQPWRDAMAAVAQETDTPLARGPDRFSGLAALDGLFLDPVHPSATGARFLASLLDETLGDQPP